MFNLSGYEKYGIDFVDLDELHPHVLALRGREVLADVVGSDRKLAVASVDEDGELDAGRAAVFEERVDRGADRAARIEHVVDEDAGLSLERKVKPGRLHDRLCVERRLSTPHGHVVPVEGDVERAQVWLLARELADQASQALRQRNAPGVDADQSDPPEVRIALDDFVRVTSERPVQGLRIEQRLSRLDGHSHYDLLSGLSGPS
jgi:hypothetical protein